MNLVVALIVLGIIIVIHELGHFLAAKAFKIKVDTFSIGFGPRIIGFRKGETDYRISAFPLGGYVRMAGENPTDEVTGAANEFVSKPKWQRFVVAIAGPVMNFVLAIVLLTGLFMHGTEVPAFSVGDAIVGSVDAGSQAEKAGIKPGDHIVAVDGKQNPTWEDIDARIVTNIGHPVALSVKRNGQVIDTSVTPVKRGPSEAGDAGLFPQFGETNVIEGVMKDSPAQRGGLQHGDVIVSVNGVEIRNNSAKEVRDSIQGIGEGQDTFPLKYVRNGETHEVQITRMLYEGKKIVGIQSFVIPTVVIKENFPSAITRSVNKNIEYGGLVFQTLRGLATRRVSPKAIDGPIGIVRAAGQFYEAGIGPLVVLMAMISLNLGLMNLLPIPILDGGVMLLLVIEGVMGRDLSLPVKERIFQVSFVFLVVLMGLVLYNDVLKLLPRTLSQ